jgi:aldehyde dehydrogenase (NAD+)
MRTHFENGATRPFAARRNALIGLRSSLKKHDEELLAAMHTDMRKPRFEAYLADIGLVYAEIDHTLKHLKEWMRTERRPTPLALQLASSEVRVEPLGVVFDHRPVELSRATVALSLDRRDRSGQLCGGETK